MNDIQKLCFVNVPLNSQGVREHENNDELMPNVATVELTADEYWKLLWVFDAWNSAFHILIALYEEDVVEAPEAPIALQILENFIARSDSTEFLATAQKLKTIVQKAVDLKMPIYLDF